jgi:hypothetical protein
VQEHHRIVVHVHHSRTGVAGLGHLMDVRAAGQAAADVDKLPDPGIAQEAYRAYQELTITAYGIQDSGITCMTCSAAARSAAKLSLPPSQKSYTRAGCAMSVRMSAGTPFSG